MDMASSVFFAALLVSVVVVCSGQNDREHWVDPHEMLPQKPPREPPQGPREEASSAKGSDDISLQSKLSQCEDKNAALQSCGAPEPKPCDTPYFKKLARTFVKTAERVGEQTVSFGLDPYQVEKLKTFVDSNQGHVQDVSELMDGILSGMRVQDSGNMSESLSHVYDHNKHMIMIIIAVLLTAAMFIILESYVIRSSWRRQLSFIFALSIIISIPWEWYHLYRTAFAKKQTEMMKDMPKHCRPDHELSPRESLWLWWKNSFSFDQDSCVKYQESLIVDPLWEVSPVKALSVTLTQVLIGPLEQVAEGVGKGFTALFRNVPVQWQPVMFLAVLIIVILGLLLVTGVHIRLPFCTIGTGHAGDQPNQALDQTLNQMLGRMEENENRMKDIQEQQKMQLKLTQKAVNGKGARQPCENDLMLTNTDERPTTKPNQNTESAKVEDIPTHE